MIADLDSVEGMALIKEALGAIVRQAVILLLIFHKFFLFLQDDTSLMRISFIHNPLAIPPTRRPLISRFMAHLISADLLSEASPAKLLHAFGLNTLVVTDDGPQIIVSGEESLQELAKGIPLNEMDMNAYDHFVKSSRLVVRELQIAPGKQALLINGRVSDWH